ncbi:sensor histidine kinase [Marilutibacter aestuarii]|uniref:Sensor histidine kinase n=1 Tax=Marilutibacter aestuarii TaxID=1706195 RepID=A0A508AWL5_9GAMM|nr:histidine kinase [Lysobacter aestuarii]TQD51465.1 sensor histidine kinase [Lysobacter aestuarii]
MAGREASDAYALGRPLPPDVLVGGNTVWGRYRQYPVFSLPWLRGRSLLFGGLIGAYALLTAFGVGFATRDYGVGVLSGLHLFVAFGLMATAGPILATWVRYRRWPDTRERRAVVVAVLAGIVISFFVDQWASSYVQAVVGDAMRAAGQSLPNAGAVSGAERHFAISLNLLVLVVIYGMFGGGLALRAYFSEQRRWREDRQRRDMARLQQAKRDSDLRLGALQAQVEPHFLFNTLASVRALVRQDADKAERTLDALVDYLRASIPRLRPGEDGALSTLGAQLDLCARYLDVMRLRMGERLHVAIEADEALRGHAFPPLLLITLVENAVKHGIEPVRGPGVITIVASLEGDRLRVRVEDDGVGLQPGVGGGVGLENVREQLRARYGRHAALALRSGAAGGCIAELDLPLESDARQPGAGHP